MVVATGALELRAEKETADPLRRVLGPAAVLDVEPLRGLVGGGNGADEVEMDAAQELGVLGADGGCDALALPGGAQLGVDDAAQRFVGRPQRYDRYAENGDDRQAAQAGGWRHGVSVT